MGVLVFRTDRRSIKTDGCQTASISFHIFQDNSSFQKVPASELRKIFSTKEAEERPRRQPSSFMLLLGGTSMLLAGLCGTMI